MLSLNQPNRVTFTVNVFGTAATPTVRVLLGETPALTFDAIKLAGNEYEALIDLPDTMKPGAHALKIEVLLNGRIFTPIQTSVTVEGEIAEPVAPIELPASMAEVPAPEPTPAPAPEPMRIDAVVGVTQPVAEQPAPAPEPKKPAKKLDVTSLMRELNKPAPAKEVKEAVEVRISAAPQLKTLESTAKKPVPKRPKAAAPAPTPLDMSFAKIAEEADRKTLPPAMTPAPAPAKIVEINTEIPVTFTRGEVIYK